MKLDVAGLSYDAKEYPFKDGAVLKIRPYPYSQGQVSFKAGALVIDGRAQCEMFKHCLVGWENVVGADGKPIPCTDEVKHKIYDFKMAGMTDFVLGVVYDFVREKENQEKN
jgi:hypothetical protein